MVLSVCAGPWLGWQPACGDEAASPPPPPAVRDLVRQLDADEFTQREEASRQLAELGAEAVPDLAKAAQGASLEASARAFAILKKFMTGDNPALQGTAREALNGIAAQRQTAEKNKDDALASAAAKAQEILGQSQPKYAGQPGVAVPVPGIPFEGPPPRILLPGRIPGHRIAGNRISVRVVDGTREVEAEENQEDGQKRNVKIVSDPKSGIRMEVTKTKDGKEVTEKYAAKDAESLKKDHPEAFKIYEQYNGAGGAVQIGGGRIHIHGGRVEIGGGGIRVVPGPRLVPEPGIDPEAELERQLRQMMEANAVDEAVLRALEEQRAVLKERRKLLEKLRDQTKPGQVNPAPPAPPAAPAPAPAEVQDDLFGK
jgi:hypothetical protein